MKLNISEIFYSLQGEGARAGGANIFIRLSGCSAKNACFKSGVLCDTEYESGKDYTLNELYNYILPFNCRNIIWTGGEPLDQLIEEVIQYFKDKGYYQALETSGIKAAPKGLNYICLSPKVAEHIVAKHFDQVDELRYVRHKGQAIPKPSITAKKYYISPHSDGYTINKENLQHCIRLVLDNPTWNLSVQQHKLWQVI